MPGSGQLHAWDHRLPRGCRELHHSEQQRLCHKHDQLSLAGAGLGLGAALLLLAPFAPLLFQTLGLPYLPLGSGQTVGLACAVLVLALLTGPLAASWSALALTRIDTYATLREGE